ncbi:Detected protein of unknown function [Hibiscus syriacus]|uniref:Isopenicillin N synthase-like Fe(2+) 2OG dioxygenase domain-containing protein n=1 Tax=Hibiscus syriacus TaxID=106335 RepID=A0A6A2YC09_HIBSY|nr:Detected protein of unknown function [Hibiscus syriacus]
MAISFDDSNSLYNFVVRDGKGFKGMVDSGLSMVPVAYTQPPIDISRLDGPEHDEIPIEIVRAAETRFLPISPTRLVKYGTSFVPEKEKALEWKDCISLHYVNDAEALQNWPTEIRCGTRVLVVLMRNLGMKPEDPKINALIDANMIRMNFYPTCPNSNLTVGIGRHSAVGTLTVSLQDEIGGLYVRIEEETSSGKKGEWVETLPAPGAMVINVGDMLQVSSL